MSLIQCPECGAKISDKATACPHCGFQSSDPSMAISLQDKYEMVPVFDYDIDDWNPNRGDLSVISYEDNRQLVQYFGNWEFLQTKMTPLAEVIKEMAASEHILVADLDPYVKKLIKEGIYRFTIDKKGRILPTIRDADHIVKQVRLRDMTYAPNLVQSLNNLSVHAVMAQILDEIEYIGDAIQGIHIELQNDRIALAESAKDKLMQARKIQDSRLRAQAILGVISSATDAKRTLMRSFTHNLSYIIGRSNQSNFKQAFDYIGSKNAPVKTQDAMQELVYITNAVQIECEGYASLGEYDACKTCLDEFSVFIKENHLNDRDTLILLNENAPQKKPELVNNFTDIAKRITSFEPDRLIEQGTFMLLYEKEEETDGSQEQ